LRSEKARIEELGARLVFVGNGSTAQANDFAREYVPGCEVYTDPSRYTYTAIGATDGLVRTLAGLVSNGLRAMRQGHFQTSIRGHVFQNGGVLVALPGNTAAYLYVSRVAGDHPPIAEVMTALGEGVERLHAAPEELAPAAPPVDGAGDVEPWPRAPKPPLPSAERSELPPPASAR
jgi:hypothetical protein